MQEKIINSRRESEQEEHTNFLATFFRADDWREIQASR